MKLEDKTIAESSFKSFDKQIEETEIEKKLSIPAKRLMEKLEPIPSKLELLQYRWFWELVQNASDFNTEVDIEVELNENSLIFRHNGQPFKLVDVENLITPDSDKDDSDIDEEYIGRFGSGFISTHVLSSFITVEGIVKDKYLDDKYYKFKFDLDRKPYTSKSELIKSIETSENQFRSFHPESEHVPGTFETIFTYDLDKSLVSNVSPKEIAKAGIEYSIKVLPLVFAFLPKLKSVKFIQNGAVAKESYFFQKKRDDQNGLCEIGCLIDRKPKDDIKVRYTIYEEVTIAVEIKDNLVVEYPEDIAVLFLYLPMIGSEKFPFPVSINSKNFKPETERNGINISENDNENRISLIKGLKAYEILLKSLSVDNVGNLYNLVVLKSDRIKALPTANSTWYQNNIEKEFKTILDRVTFVDCNGKPISYAELKIPFIPENKTEIRDLIFYDTVKDLIIDKVPSRSEFPKWLKNIDFTIFKTVPFRLEAAVKIVEDTGSLDELSKLLKKDITETTDWLAIFIKYVADNEVGLLTQHKIIPCKSVEGKFVNRDAEIYVDDGVDAGLIAVFNKMKNKNYEDRLLNDVINREIKDLLPPAKIKTSETIALEIDSIFRVCLDENTRLSKEELEGLNLLLKWLKVKGFPDWNELSKYFPTFHGSYSNFFMESFDEEEKVKAITIRNSGKQDTLLKIAESDISESDLNTVIDSLSEVKDIIGILDSGTSISKLSQLSRLFPDDIPDNLMKYAEEEARQKREFNNLLYVGSKVEEIFIETLKSYEVDSNRKKIIHAGGGSYDIRIYNPDLKKSFYIELKSCKFQNTDPINIAISQAERAVKELENENFAIVVIERAIDNEMDIEYVKNSCKYFKNPGKYLGDIVDSYNTIKKTTNKYIEIDLKMDNAEFKGALEYTWLLSIIGNLGFNELIKDITKILS
ncbi:sacsin N-terminal ATP-binding-like domain-containing protein [Chryseobacterium bernardetii]|uniref:sacsin N-terminal ATP-binding-like domain-containing protein n=1 Tax=Chryseobacterium bernardetii TaxID=1241978 RepID=UPI003AF7B692